MNHAFFAVLIAITAFYFAKHKVEEDIVQSCIAHKSFTVAANTFQCTPPHFMKKMETEKTAPEAAPESKKDDKPKSLVTDIPG